MSNKLVTMETEDNYLFMFMTPWCLQLYKLSKIVKHFYNASMWTFFYKRINVIYIWNFFFIIFYQKIQIGKG